MKKERIKTGEEAYFEPCSTASETPELPELVFREESFRA